VANLAFAASVVVAEQPGRLYDMVSDITRMGEWSPVCTGCWWDGDGPARVGARFTGHNETPDRTWETHCEVVAAEPGQEFAFLVGASFVRWGYTFAPVEDGTEVTESWEFLPAGIAMFEERFGADAKAEIDKRTEAAHSGIPATLAAIKRAAESR
jgi:hypothetical protein